ncbi:MAG: TolC family protein [Proteobacteria bacterium]|nr:TolC family protein [Pseudomonadota bacterium]
MLLSVSAPAAEEKAAPLGALDLRQCYERALKQSENIAISEEVIRQAEEQYRQTWAQIPPRLSFQWQELYQDPSQTKLRQPQGAFKLQLPALTGYREMAALRSATAITRRREYEMKRAEQSLLVDVAQAFWNVIQIENQIQVTKSQQALMQDRIKELSERERIGRSREAEVVAAQSQLAGIEANREELEQARVLARESLAFFTGADKDVPLADTIPLPDQPNDLSRYLDSARQRPDILAQKEVMATSQAAVKVARSGHYPNLSINTNYYPVREGNQGQGPIKWDFMAAIEVPLYSWGQVQSSIREANSRLRATELALKLQERQVETEVRNAWDSLRAFLSELNYYEKVVALADRNYKLQAGDYRRGLVSNLEVLQALTDLYAARLRRDQVQYAAKLNAIRLAVAAGAISRFGGEP